MNALTVYTLVLSVFVLQRTASQTITDGNDWGDWSPCSRTCGVGVMYQNKKCLDVTDDGSCPKSKRQYRTCNIQDCPDGSGDFRYEQCASNNNKTLEGKKYKWVPYIPEHDICGLNCMPKGQYFYYQWAPKVIDGTRCGPESYDICVNGKCEPLGCDLIMNSTAKEDKCRVCNGDGDNCRTITGQYNSSGDGYKEFIVIPRSATNIVITETNYMGHFLALADEKGNFFFNGNFDISNPKTFKIADSFFRYERSSLGKETIRSLGPTTEPIHALVLLRYDVDNPTITYEFSVPKSVIIPDPTEYKWKTSSYGSCSASCSGGEQFRQVVCVRVRDQKEVSSNKCDPATRPAAKRRCNTHSCPSRWYIDSWSPCSVTCGSGKQVRRIHCEHVIEGGETQMIADNRCASPKPISMRRCMLQNYCPTWSSTRWSQCSASCDEGQVTRQVTCQDAKGGIISESSCDEKTRPKTIARCNPGPCSVKWTASKWSECYPRCGDGISTRIVYCISVHDDNLKYPSSLCNNSTRPASAKKCFKEGSCSAIWHGSQWSRCTSSCGTGMQMRNVMCAVQERAMLRIVPRSQCNASYVMPTTRKCFSRPCHAGWYIHPWQACSKSCGIGVTRRDVRCIADGNVVPDERWCDKKVKPVKVDICHVERCLSTGLPTINTQLLRTGTTRKTFTDGNSGISVAFTTTEAPTTTQEPITTQATSTETPTTRQELSTKQATTTETLITTQESTSTKATTTETLITTQEPATTETPSTAQEATTTQETNTETPKTVQEPAPTQRQTTTVKIQPATNARPTTKVRVTRKPITVYQPTVPVTIVKAPKDKVTYQDSEVLMRCRATGNPPPMITWRKGMMPVSALGERFKILEDGTLKIIKVTTRDEAKYTCFAGNFVSPMVNATSKLTVIVPVSVTVEPSNNVDVSVGEELVLKCVARGKPTPRVTWYKDGQIISLSSGGISIPIKSVSLNDAGTYECQASHGYGTDSALVLVYVKDEVPDPVSPTAQQVCTKDVITTCNFVKQVGFCKNNYYKKVCCLTCREVN